MANTSTLIVDILGMECNACTQSVERAVGALSGIQNVSVSLDEEKASIAFDPSLVDESSIRSAILAFSSSKETLTF